MNLLRLGGYSNLLIASGHLVGLIWAERVFAITGIGNEMNELAQIHASLPYILTLLVSIVFFIFGLYGLSAGHKFRKLPFLKFGVFAIAGIYLFRGLGEIIWDTIQGTPSTIEMLYSLIALAIGLLYLFGGLQKWNVKQPTTSQR